MSNLANLVEALVAIEQMAKSARLDWTAQTPREMLELIEKAAREALTSWADRQLEEAY